MCFDDDYGDWSADVHREESGPAPHETRCDECGENIRAGQWRHHVFMQQHEECEECLCFDEDEEPFEHVCYFGETFTYNRCEACDKILRAIEAVETEEDCPQYARRPALLNLYDELHEHSQAGMYAQRAIAMFPELSGLAILQEAMRQTV